MYYALAYFPDVDSEGIQRIREKYDPTVDLIEPHIGVLFPVPDAVGKPALLEHVERVLQSWKPFPIRIRGLQKSWDHWLLLTLEEGSSDVVRLYGDIYTGILARYRRDDLEFVPHLALGLFVRKPAEYDFRDPRQLEFDEQKYGQALREAEALKLDFTCLLDVLHLVELTDDFSRITRGPAFTLGPARRTGGGRSS